MLLLRPPAILAGLMLIWGQAGAEDDPLAVDRAIVAIERQRAQLTQAWEKERADLERLAAARVLANQAAAAHLAEAAARLQARAAQEQALRDHATALLSEAEQVHATIEAIRSAWAVYAPVAANLTLADGAPMLAQLRDAAALFDRLKAASARWEVEVAEGRLPDGAVIPVQVLEAGLACAWYLQLDGRGAGLASRSGKVWLLAPDQDGEAVPNIAAAIAQFRGNSVPQSVLLPAPVAGR